MTTRRRFVAAAAGLAGSAQGFQLGLPSPGQPTVAPAGWRGDFPALNQTIGGRQLVYLDSAATTLRPRPVIAALNDYFGGPNANPNAGQHALARRSHQLYQAARSTVAGFLGAVDPLEVVFTRGTTEAINLVAAAWGRSQLRAGDEILLSRAEHASNTLPWQLVADAVGARVETFRVDPLGMPDWDDYRSKLARGPRLVAVSQVSNVLGTIVPVRELVAMAHERGAVVLVDGAQSVPHLAVDVRQLGCDFLTLSGHKMGGPMGIGCLWGRRELLDAMAPYQTGSNMAHDVDLDSRVLSEGALKFEAGTPNVAGAIGLAAAVRYLQTIGFDALWNHERELINRMLARLNRLSGVRLLGREQPDQRIAVFSFTVTGLEPKEVARRLDLEAIAVRAGDLSALPLLETAGLRTAVRASCYLYTSVGEIDVFGDALEAVIRSIH